jgi:hypothetical protein
MWTLIKIGTFYAAPILAVVAALVLFVVLLRRVRRGTLPRASAGLLYACTLLFPLAAVVAIWGVGEAASYAAAGAGSWRWDWQASSGLLSALLPIAGYVAIPITVLVVAFWIVVMRTR